MLKLALIDLESEAQRAFINALPIPVMVADARGSIAFCNDCWHEYTGQPKSEPDTERTWSDYLHPDDRDRIVHDWQTAIADDVDVVEMEYRLKEAKSGLYRWFHVRATALRGEDARSTQWIAAAMDINEERQQQLTIARLYEDSLALTRTLQSAMLQPALPGAEGLRFDAVYRPAHSNLSIAGDWYDAFVLPDGSIVVGIGDVTGQGLGAAVLMAKARFSMRALAFRVTLMRSGGPASMLRSVEEALLSEHPNASATAFLGIIEPHGASMRYANAGHPPPLILAGSGRFSWLEAGDPPLGWRFGEDLHDRVVDLTGVSRLLLYT
ncbi:MAG: SpoIIE family protein phosphatase, partial [Polyangiaceae bacterium]